ncbi:MAG: hypothetical protein JWM20_480 [Patescibacteria group bacterium]|nr:hypothetical protein [Patescibacteria group bacterium]
MIKWNEVTWYSKTLALILFIVVIPLLAFCIGVQYQQVVDIRTVAPKLAVQVAIPHQAEVSTSKTKCYQNEKYFVISQWNGGLGDDFLIASLRSNQDVLPCTFSLALADFTLADYNFLSLKGKYLVLDEGSAPSPRGISIVDLEQKKTVFVADYDGGNSPDHKVTFTDNSMTYWEWLRKTQVATSENCPVYEAIMNTTGNPVFVQMVTVDFATLQKKYSGTSECVAFQ